MKSGLQVNHNIHLREVILQGVKEIQDNIYTPFS